MYFPPYLDGAGLHTPLFSDLQTNSITQAQGIFGSDIYLTPDTQDFEWISAFNKADYDTLQGLILAYNAHSPLTATDVTLDQIVAINGLTRLQATFSTAPVQIVGTGGTLISNGVCADTNGNLWNLPSAVVIGSGNVLNTTVTAQIAGPIPALSGQINVIQTPTSGWTSIVNTAAANPGVATESDSALRLRQQQSVEQPSQALTGGIIGGVLAVDGVTSATIYENDTGEPITNVNNGYNPSGFPPHSITIVTNGGDGQTIANAIGVRKTPGCYTAGDQVYQYTDSFGNQTPIRFYLADVLTINVLITIEQLFGYNSQIMANIQTSTAAYINSLKIGQDVVNSMLWGAALQANVGSQYPYFSVIKVQAEIASMGYQTADLVLNYNQIASTTIGNIIIQNNGDNAFVFSVASNSMYLPII